MGATPITWTPSSCGAGPTCSSTSSARPTETTTSATKTTTRFINICHLFKTGSCIQKLVSRCPATTFTHIVNPSWIFRYLTRWELSITQPSQSQEPTRYLKGISRARSYSSSHLSDFQMSANCLEIIEADQPSRRKNSIKIGRLSSDTVARSMWLVAGRLTPRICFRPSPRFWVRTCLGIYRIHWAMLARRSRMKLLG